MTFNNWYIIKGHRESEANIKPFAGNLNPDKPDKYFKKLYPAQKSWN